MLRNFSFVIENRLAGCAHPQSMGDCNQALAELKEHGIGAIVSADETGIPLYLIADHDFHYLHLPIPDFGVPTREQVAQFIEFVTKEIADGRSVTVHCGAGFGRTGTLLACYLVKTGMNAREAIRTLRHKRPGSIETPEQEEFIFTCEEASEGRQESKLRQIRNRFRRKRS
jgi:atypical dual specificity phosphatase